MPTGDFPDSEGKIWTDDFGWIDKPAPTPIQQGCICPPTSEQTCRNPFCPRGGMQNLKIT